MRHHPNLRMARRRIPFFPFIPLVPLTVVLANVIAMVTLYRRLHRLEMRAAV